MRLFLTLLIVSLLPLACKEQVKEEDDNTIVRIGGNVLKKKELVQHISEGINREDSLIASENYIRSWIRDALIYDIAEKNISDKDEIDRLVESYRKSLIIYQYKDQLVNEKLSKEIGDGEMKKFYEENRDRFLVDKKLIKGLFLKIPINAPQTEKVRTWYKSSSTDALENIEKYSIQNAVIYDYFCDRWIELNDVIEKIPPTISESVSTMQSTSQVELQDSSFYYFLNVKEIILPGEKAPFEYAKQTIREIIINQKKMNYLKEIEDNLYNTAQRKGEIKYYKE